MAFWWVVVGVGVGGGAICDEKHHEAVILTTFGVFLHLMLKGHNLAKHYILQSTNKLFKPDSK